LPESETGGWEVWYAFAHAAEGNQAVGVVAGVRNQRQAGRGGTRAARRELKSAHPAVDGCIKKIRSALNASHWNDNVRRDFERSLENIANLAKQIPAASEESQKMLNRKALQLDQYFKR
jgi:hypothetical protein